MQEKSKLKESVIMKKLYISPDAEIEKFVVARNVFCTLSNEGNEIGDTGEYVDDEF